MDVAEEWRRAGVVVDGLQGSVAIPELRGILDGARSRLDVSADGAYTQAGDLVAAQVDAATRALEAAVLRVDDPEAMVRAAGELTGAVRLRSDVFGLVANLFGARFPEASGAGRSIAQLRAERVRYTDTIRTLSVEDDPSPAFLGALRALTEQSSTRSFLDAVDAVLGLPALAAAQPDGPADLVEQTASFNDSLLMVEQVGVLVDTGSVDLATTGQDLTATAEQMRLRVVAAVVLVGSVTIGIVALLSHWLVRSLHGVSLSAGAMNEGDLDLPAAVRGPLEVRVAAQALNGASTNIRSAEQQVLALADGDLAAAERIPVPGRLGESLHVAFARLAESLRDREELRAELHHEANYDGLTGLPNRSAVLKGLRAAVERSNAHGEQIAVLFVDIDGFKSINDQHGHGVGDEVLQGISGRVRNAARSTDVVGRLGGDEFVVIAHPVNGVEEALGLARRIRGSVSRPLRTAVALTPSISIGLAMGSGDGRTPDQLLHDADLAVYEAKGAGGNVIEVCTPALRRTSEHRQAVEKELAEAIAGDDLTVAVQAIVRLDDGAVEGVEALVRWPGADGTLRSPGEFVPIAERSSLVVELDRRVIDQTVRLLCTWAGDPRTAGLHASVNISARHASTTAFSEYVLDTLARYEVEPRRLAVEITESALIGNLDHVVDQLRHLRESGVTVAVDDFGTGYTSFALLHQLPIDTLKLDRVLIADLGDARVHAVVKLIVDTAHLMGLTVTAEGVETVGQVEQLRELGVDALQGFLLHRPCEPGALVDGLVSAGDGLGVVGGVGNHAAMLRS